MSDQWNDGICKSCGSIVIEMSGLDMDDDYKNMCKNPDCKEHYWHSCGDMEQLDYYDHDCTGVLE